MAHDALDREHEPRVYVAWIAERVDDPAVRVVEVDVSGAAYNGGHIPGAVLWNAYADLRLPDHGICSAILTLRIYCGS